MEKSSVIKLIKPKLSQPEIDAVAQVLRTGMLVSGPVVQEFERKLAEYLGARHVLCVSSGTAALHLALLAAEIKPEDEVLVPAYTFPATANVVENMGAVPIFVDCAENSVNLDIKHIENCIKPQTKAIMPVHAFGYPADMNTILAIAHKYNLRVIEDAACALGSKYNDKYCGLFGDFAAFSFHPRKLLTTGEGGAVVASDPISAQLIKSLRNHGYDDGEYRYPGYNYRMTDFQAAMGITQLAGYAKYLEQRKQLAHEIAVMLKDIDWLTTVRSESNTEPNMQTLIIRLADDIDRQALIGYLASQGIEATIGTYCVPLTHYYRVRYGYRPEDFPQAFKAYDRSLSLPLYHDMSAAEQSAIVVALKRYEPQSTKVSV
jgi:perosamine synthetase